MTQRVVDESGQVYELQGRAWVPVRDAAPAAPAGPREALATGPFNAAMVGTGDFLTTAGRNVRDLFASIRGDKDAQFQIAAERQEADEIRARLQEEAPIASRIGAALPVLATLPLGLGPVAAGSAFTRAMLGTGSTLGRVAEQVGTGALTGALGSETGELGAGGLEGGAWGAGGVLAGQMIGRVQAARAARRQAQAAAGIAPGTLSEGEQAILEGAQRAGMRATPGQLAGSTQARQLEAALASNPMTSQAFAQLDEANRAQMQRLGARAMGVEADNVGPVARAEAADQIARQFQEVGRALGTVNVTPLIDRIRAIGAEESTSLLPEFAAQSVIRRLEQGVAGREAAAAGSGAEITGEALMQARSKTARAMRDAYNANRSELGDLFGQVLEAIDDTAARTLRGKLGDDGAGAIVDLYDRTRDQWNVLRAFDRGGAALDGSIQVGRMAQILGQSDKTRFLRQGAAEELAGRRTLAKGTGTVGENPLGDFYDALRFKASPIGRDIVGNSGTATRSALQGVLTGGSIVGSLAGGARRLAVTPIVQAYARMSPDAARQWMATYEGMRRAEMGAASGRGGAVGRAAAAVFGG